MSLIEPTTTPSSTAVAGGACRFCGQDLRDIFVDLGMSPLCESFLAADQLNHMEPFYPLRVFVCRRCGLAQLQKYVDPSEIFTEYAYFSSYSTAWLAHARTYTEVMRERLALGSDHLVVELASNDGYLLQYFVEAGVPVLGVEPALNVAAAAVDKGVPTLTEFFDETVAHRLVAEGKAADLIIANNVLAHTPHLNPFVAGMRILLKPRGVITVEFPHLMRLIDGNQFDTIYHEHFSYFSFLAAERVFAAHGLTVFDVEELWTHGGSLRLFIRHAADHSRPPSNAVAALRAREEEAGYADPPGGPYASFEQRVRATKRNLLEFLIDARRMGKRVAGYGAPGKGNTLLNYCGIGTDFLDFTVDRNPYKHGKFLPGTHIPIHPPGQIEAARPDYILILPWNLQDEIMTQLAHARDWGARFVVPIPELAVR
jgi:SAM-dependent methyltransferase